MCHLKLPDNISDTGGLIHRAKGYRLNVDLNQALIMCHLKLPDNTSDTGGIIHRVKG